MICPIFRYSVFVIFFIILSHSTTYAQSGPWFVRFDYGTYDIYNLDERGRVLGFRFGQSGKNGFARFEASFIHGTSEIEFRSFEFGFDLRLIPKSPFTPVLGLGVGRVVVGDTGAVLLKFETGFDVSIGSTNSIRLLIQRAVNSFGRGPHLYTIGLEHRFGKYSYD